MAKISINLLPAEFIAESIKNAKFYKVQAAGVAAIMLMVFLSSLVVALRILQSKNISAIQSQVAASEQQISGLKNTQASLFLLKNRLTTINQYLGVPSSSSQMYNLILTLIPPSVAVNSISVDKSSEVLLSVTASDTEGLDLLLTNLTNPESNEGKISQVSLEGVARGRDGIYKLNLKIKPK